MDGPRYLRLHFARQSLHIGTVCWYHVDWREELTWVVVKIMVPFWISIIIRHLISRVPKKGP